MNEVPQVWPVVAKPYARKAQEVPKIERSVFWTVLFATFIGMFFAMEIQKRFTMWEVEHRVSQVQKQIEESNKQTLWMLKDVK